MAGHRGTTRLTGARACSRGVALLCLLVACLASAGIKAQQAQRIAAVVNDEVVSVQDVEQRLRLIVATSGLPDNEETRRRLAPQVLRGLIDERIQLQEAERQKVEIPSEDLDRAVAVLEERNRMPRGGLKALINRLGLDEEAAVDQVRASLAWNRLVRRRFGSVVQVGADEIDEVLARLKEVESRPQLRISMIVLNVESPEREDEVRRLAQRLVEQARSGANFAALAQQFSEDANAATAGDIGWVAPGQLDPVLEQAAERLAPGQISDPIRSLLGYHVILLQDRRVVGAPPPTEARVKLAQLFLPVPAGAKADEIEAQAALAETIAGTAKDCTDLGALAREAKSPAGPDLGTLKVGELAGPLREAVMPLKAGDVSKPVRLPTGVVVLMVCERQEPPSNLPSREQIRQRLELDKLEVLARRYLRDLRLAAFIELRV